MRESLRAGTPSRWTVGDRVVVELNGGLYVGETGTLDSGSIGGGFVWFGDKSNCRSQHFEPSKKESTFPMESQPHIKGVGSAVLRLKVGLSHTRGRGSQPKRWQTPPEESSAVIGRGSGCPIRRIFRDNPPNVRRECMVTWEVCWPLIGQNIKMTNFVRDDVCF
jgi:hypothetical protein